VTSSINQRIFDTSQDLILVVDRQGLFARVSPSSLAILGYRPEEMVGSSAADFVFPDDLEGTRAEMRLARHGRLMRNFDCRYLHKEGYVVPLAWMGAWSEPEQQFFFIGRDMTERIAHEEQLRQAQKMEAVGQLTGGLAHDFNNLLTVILGNAEFAQEKLAGNEEVLALLRTIEAAAQRGADLTRRLLAFSRRQALRPVAVNLNHLVTEMERLLLRALGEEVDIRASLAPGIWAAMVDAAQVENALLNLAVNARDAMSGGGKLSIETANSRLDEDTIAAYRLEAVPGDYVVLSVADTGTGMSAEVLKRAFEPFFTTKPIGKGSGLGLSMVYGFVKQSGGFIKIYSEPKQGTTVKLYLPRAKGADAVEAGARDAEAPAKGGRECILVVEDDELVRSYVVSRLDGLGYRVLEAENGQRALALVGGADKVDLMFTDVILPEGLNGRELADEARRIRPAIRFLFTSGYTQETMIHHGKLDPGIALLNKPYRKEDLARKIREVLDAPDGN
jgi:PAS domain S-box-containing protein